MKKLGFLLTLLTILISSSIFATEFFEPEPLFTLEGEDAAPWAAIELHQDFNPRIPPEQSHSNIYQFYPQIVKTFGSNRPSTQQFLLHLGTGWDTYTKGIPVIFIHGANDDATRRFAKPLSPLDKKHHKFPGMMQYLAKRGYATFAISFSHFHGDNIIQGEHIANAITRIKTLYKKIGRPIEKVDLVGISKGAMAIRSYVQSAPSFYPTYSYLTKYRNDVNHIVFIASPLGGIDTPFRYYLYNFAIQLNKLLAPCGASKILVNGKWQSTGERNILSGNWHGQLQMLFDQRKIGVVGSILTHTMDLNHTKKILRDGGNNSFVVSPGITKAAEAGGFLVESLNLAHFPSDITYSILAGDRNVLTDERYPELIIPILTDPFEPSDGVIFLKSSTYHQALKTQPSQQKGMKVLHLNHLELSRSKKAFKFIQSQLSGAR